MKAQYEKIAPDIGSSFRLLRWKSIDDKYYWHQHPEHEIILVKKGSGKLHIGNYTGTYQKGDILVLGANLPHTGLGHGVIGEHEEIIIQLKESFLGNEFLESPEMKPIKKLFSNAIYGILFTDTVNNKIGTQIETLLQTTGLDRLIKLLEILKLLADNNSYKILNSKDVRSDLKYQDELRINNIYDYVTKNYKNEIHLSQIAEIANLTVPSLCRYFKKMTNATITHFINEYRINIACKILHGNSPITDVCFEAGFNNLSYFNKTFKLITGQNPSQYRNQIKPKL